METSDTSLIVSAMKPPEKEDDDGLIMQAENLIEELSNRYEKGPPKASAVAEALESIVRQVVAKIDRE